MQDHTYGLFLSDKHTSKYVFQATANEDNVAPNTNMPNQKNRSMSVFPFIVLLTSLPKSHEINECR